MNKSELIEALAPRLGGRTQAAAAVEAMVDVILREVAAGGSVGITGFGTFEKVDRAPRTGRNPRTGEAVPIAGTRSPRFRPGAYFKDVVADPTALPARGLAGARVGSEPTAEPTGAPRSVRRTAGSTGAGSPKKAAGKQSASGSRPRTSGTPDSVRKPASPPSEKSAEEESTSTTAAASGGRVMSGGEDITMGMISAKKAQLARVKNDQLAKKAKKAKKKDEAKKDQDGKKGKKDKDGKKSEKSDKKGKKK